MIESVEHSLRLSGFSILIETSEWNTREVWTCPPSSHVLCQRLSPDHRALRLEIGNSDWSHAYPRVHSLGFMPSDASIRLSPLGQPLRTLTCFFDSTYFESVTSIDANGWSSLAGSFMPVKHHGLAAMMRRIHDELVRPGFGSELAIESACAMVAIEMARMGREHCGLRARPAKVAPGLAPWQMRRIRERLAEEPVTGYPGVAELAALCGISRGHLMRMFKATTGKTVYRHVADERLSAAKRLLSEGRASIKEVAAALGFSSSGHFTRAFQRDAGMTPSEFRRRAGAMRIIH